MKKVISTVLAAVFLAGTAAVAPVPASAGDFRFGFYDHDNDWRWRHRNHRGWDRDWDRHSRWDRRGHWDRDDWRWRRHRHDDDFDGGDAAAAIIGGLAAGAIAGTIAGAVDNDSYARCSAEYRSFDPDSWTYLGYDGRRHRCNL